ncbi:MAG: hypothetical protein IJ897_00715 [Prevotella sp.]|nr:hypothetical protein [Prevotella sp.]
MAKGNSWKTRNWRSGIRESRKVVERTFRGEPQYTLDQLYISPFTRRKRWDKDGHWQYVTMERNMSPTGITVMDDYLRYLANGNNDMQAFADRYGLKREEVAGMIFILTGVKGIRFRQLYQMRLVDDLLRYTDMDPVDVARRSGLGSKNNMYLALRREYNQNIGERRNFLRKENDLGRFGL